RASSGSATPNSSSAWSMEMRICASLAPARTRRSLAKSACARLGSGPLGPSLSLRQSACRPRAVANVTASTSTGRSPGRIGGATIHSGPALFSLGMTPARSRCPQQRDQLGAALSAPRFEPLDQPAYVIVAAKVDRGVFFLEGEQARKGRAVSIPFETTL